MWRESERGLGVSPRASRPMKLGKHTSHRGLSTLALTLNHQIASTEALNCCCEMAKCVPVWIQAWYSLYFSIYNKVYNVSTYLAKMKSKPPKPTVTQPLGEDNGSPKSNETTAATTVKEPWQPRGSSLLASCSCCETPLAWPRARCAFWRTLGTRNCSFFEVAIEIMFA